MKQLGHTLLETSHRGFHPQPEPMLVPYLKNQKYKVSSQSQNDPSPSSLWRRPCEDEGTFESMQIFHFIFESKCLRDIMYK